MHIKIIKEGIHFGKKAKIVETRETEVLVFIDENIIAFQNNEIEFKAKKVKVPRSRKDFYYFIQRNSQKESLKILDIYLKEKKIVLKDLKKQTLTEVFKKDSKQEIIIKIRELRDQGLLEFNLPNR